MSSGRPTRNVKGHSNCRDQHTEHRQLCQQTHKLPMIAIRKQAGETRSDRNAQCVHGQVDGDDQVRERCVDALVRQSLVVLEEVAGDVYVQ